MKSFLQTFGGFCVLALMGACSPVAEGMHGVADGFDRLGRDTKITLTPYQDWEDDHREYGPNEAERDDGDDLQDNYASRQEGNQVFKSRSHLLGEMPVGYRYNTPLAGAKKRLTGPEEAPEEAAVDVAVMVEEDEEIIVTDDAETTVEALVAPEIVEVVMEEAPAAQPIPVETPVEPPVEISEKPVSLSPERQPHSMPRLVIPPRVDVETPVEPPVMQASLSDVRPAQALSRTEPVTRRPFVAMAMREGRVSMAAFAEEMKRGVAAPEPAVEMGTLEEALPPAAVPYQEQSAVMNIVAPAPAPVVERPAAPVVPHDTWEPAPVVTRAATSPYMAAPSVEVFSLD